MNGRWIAEAIAKTIMDRHYSSVGRLPERFDDSSIILCEVVVQNRSCRQIQNDAICVIVFNRLSTVNPTSVRKDGSLGT